MKEQYQRAFSQIHVPNELLIKTKQAMKAEEQRLGSQAGRAKVISFRVVSVAAAVLAIVLVIPFASGLLKPGSGEVVKEPGVQLAGTVHTEMGFIAKGNKAEKRVFTITEADIMPEEWTDLEEITVAEKQMIITMDEETGFWLAYDAESGIVISSEITDKEVFIKELEDIK